VVSSILATTVAAICGMSANRGIFAVCEGAVEQLRERHPAACPQRPRTACGGRLALETRRPTAAFSPRPGRITRAGYGFRQVEVWPRCDPSRRADIPGPPPVTVDESRPWTGVRAPPAPTPAGWGATGRLRMWSSADTSVSLSAPDNVTFPLSTRRLDDNLARVGDTSSGLLLASSVGPLSLPGHRCESRRRSGIAARPAELLVVLRACVPSTLVRARDTAPRHAHSLERPPRRCSMRAVRAIATRACPVWLGRSMIPCCRGFGGIALQPGRRVRTTGAAPGAATASRPCLALIDRTTHPGRQAAPGHPPRRLALADFAFEAKRLAESEVLAGTAVRSPRGRAGSQSGRLSGHSRRERISGLSKRR